MTMNSKGVIDQSVGGVPEPLLTVRPRYVADQKVGIRGRRARLRIVASTFSKSIKTAERTLSDNVRKQLVGNGMTSFLITSMSYGFAEKTQVSETFGDSITVMAFGASPVVLNISGFVTDDLDNDWFVRLIYAYKDYIRATKLAKNFDLVRLDMPGSSFVGAILGLDFTQDSSNDALVPFRLQFLVRSYQFYSTQGFDDDLLKDNVLEAVGTDGTMTQTSLNELKKNKTALGPFSEISGYVGDLAKSFPSIGGFGSAYHGVVAVGNRLTESDFVKKAIELGHKVEGTADKINTVKRGLDMFKKATDTSPHTGRTYTLSVIGTYSSALEYAGSGSAVTQFLGDTKQNLDYFAGVIDTITKSKAGKFLLKGKNLDKAKGLIKDIKSLSKIVGVVKGLSDPVNGLLGQGVAVFDSLKETGKAFKNMVGITASNPVTSVDKLSSGTGLLDSLIMSSGAGDALAARPKPSIDDLISPPAQPALAFPGLVVKPALVH